MIFPNFETPRLRLTQIIEEDGQNIFSLFSDERVIEYYDLTTFHDLSQASNLISFFQQRFQNKEGIRWAIRLKENNKLIGTCGFNSWNIKMKHAVIGYDLHPDYWSQGLAHEAVDQIIVAAFSGELPCGQLNRIQGDTVPGNSASEALLVKLKFKEEGVRRECGYWKGQFHDLKCFGLIRSEFSAG